jgi:hypothetical protein
MAATNFERAYAVMEQLVQKCHRPEPDETALTVVACVSKGLASAGGDAAEAGELFGHVAEGLSLIRAIAKSGEVRVLPNPHFVQNGIGGLTPSPACEAFMRRENFAKVGTEAFMIVGDATHGLTAGVNTTSAVVHGSATATSAIHLAKVLAFANRKQFDKSATVQGWCKLLMTMKGLRASIHGAGLAGAVVPCASLPTKIATAIASIGIKLTMTNVCFATAAAIHWRAYREMTLGKMFARRAPGAARTGVHGKPAGPASELFWEMMTRRGFSRFWQDDIESIILEPAGWRVLGAKLIQM